MKTVKTVLKILTALATIAGAVYIIATYGDKIVAWAKKLLASCPCKCSVEDCADVQVENECPCEAPAEEETPVEEAPATEEAIEEEPVIEVTASEAEPVADEADFAE